MGTSSTSVAGRVPSASPPEAQQPTEAQGPNTAGTPLKPVYNFRAPMEIIHVIIKSGTRFPVVAQFLLPESKYFTRALEGDWMEADDREVTLDGDVTDEDFAFLLQWVYTGTIMEELPEPKGKDQSITHTAQKLSWPQLVSLWLLGDYLIMPNFQNHVIDTMFFKIDMEETEKASVIVDPRVWTHVPSNSPLLRFFLELFKLPPYFEKININASTIPNKFLKSALGSTSRLFRDRMKKFETVKTRICRQRCLSAADCEQLIENKLKNIEFTIDTRDFHLH